MNMPVAEFDIIRHYFTGTTGQRDDVILGIGDDAALLKCEPGIRLVEASATAYPDPHQSPVSLANNLLTTCIQGLLIQQAKPAWLSLSLTLEQPDEAWLQSFSAELLSLAQAAEITLVGGDTTRGHAHMTLSLIGHRGAGASDHGN
jgi:thiamine-monophosphate kinase